MKRKTFDNYDYEEAFPVELDRDIQKKARKNFEKEHPLQVPDYEEQWKEQQEKLKEWELERLLKEGKVESLYRTTTTKAKNLQSGSELLEAQIYPSFCHKADVPHTKKGRESKPSQKNLNDKNSRRYFIRLANINFGENDLWCTFTWDKEHIPADEAAADRDIGQWFAARWTDIKNALSTVATWFQTMFQNAYTNVKNVFSAIGQWFNDRYTDIKSVFSTVGSWFYTKFTEAYTNIKNVFSNIGSFFSGIWNTIKGIFTNVGTNIGEAIGGAFKSAMNNALATVERAVNKAISFINGAIDVINDIPGVSIGHVGEVSLPRLAKGGVLKNGQAIMAEAGPELIQMVNGEAVVTPLTASARNTALETAEGGGKSFVQNVNITSPKALSPYETARQTRNATRNMVLQLQGG